MTVLLTVLCLGEILKPTAHKGLWLEGDSDNRTISHTLVTDYPLLKD